MSAALDAGTAALDVLGLDGPGEANTNVLCGHCGSRHSVPGVFVCAVNRQYVGAATLQVPALELVA